MRDIDQTDHGERPCKDLLLQDYTQLSDSLWKSEQAGETRVNWFIGIATAVSAAMATLASAEKGLREENLRMVVVAFLSAMLVIGIITLGRMLIRNDETDRIKSGLDALRQLFKDRFDDQHILINFHPFGKKSSRKFGGLAHLVAGMNSLLAAGLIAAWLYPSGGLLDLTCSLWLYGIVAIAFSFFAILQSVWICIRKTRSEESRKSTRITHAGAVVYREREKVVEYLLIGPKKEIDGEWVFPKGHIEEEEGHGEAALREVMEETGLSIRLICPAGIVEFKHDSQTVRAKYYLAEMLFETTTGEQRRRQWLPFDEALAQIKHSEAKFVLCCAEHKRPDFAN